MKNPKLDKFISYYFDISVINSLKTNYFDHQKYQIDTHVMNLPFFISVKLD